MLVAERMSHPVLTISPDIPVQDALARMKKENVHRFPVVNKEGFLVGIVTDTDLMNAHPSDATTLSVWEANYLISKITVERVMAKEVVTVTEDTTIENAARIMADTHISGLPVLRSGKLVGIITESDLFRIFLEMLGARHPGVRVTMEVKDTPGALSKITGVINDLGGDIHGMGAIQGESTDTSQITLKVSGVDLLELKKGLLPLVEKMLDIRDENNPA